MSETVLLPEFAGFFESARRGRLAFPRCDGCGRFHWYPMPRCPHCRGSSITWTPVSSRGELFSYTRVQHAFDESRRGRLPYIVGMVTFAEAPGVRLITNIIGAEAEDLVIGQPVEAVFPAAGEEKPLVLFRPVAAGSGAAA